MHDSRYSPTTNIDFVKSLAKFPTHPTPPPKKKQKTSSPCEPKDKPKNRDLQENKTKTSPLVSKELNNLTRNELSYQDYTNMSSPSIHHSFCNFHSRFLCEKE